MATQPTNLPVPSESPRDLKFNAGKIDEFVTSLALKYKDRFGGDHYTIEGLRQLAQQAIAAYGWVPMDSFQDGATLTLPNQVLRWKLPDGDGDYYRWDGVLPKVVPAASTPESTGGIGAGKWLSVGDAVLRTELSESDGATLVGGSSYVVDSFDDALHASAGNSKVIITRGHTTTGIGSATYIRNDSIGTPSTGNELSFYDASGRGWTLRTDGVIDCRQFGVKGDGTNETVKVQLWLDCCAEVGAEAYIPSTISPSAIGVVINSNHNGLRFNFEGFLKFYGNGSAPVNKPTHIDSGACYCLYLDGVSEISGFIRIDGNRADKQDLEQVHCIGLFGGSNHNVSYEFKECQGDGLLINQLDGNATSAIPTNINIQYFKSLNSDYFGRNALSVISVEGLIISTFISLKHGGIIDGRVMPGGLDIEPNYFYQKCTKIVVNNILIDSGGNHALGIYGKVNPSITNDYCVKDVSFDNVMAMCTNSGFNSAGVLRLSGVNFLSFDGVVETKGLYTGEYIGVHVCGATGCSINAKVRNCKYASYIGFKPIIGLISTIDSVFNIHADTFHSAVSIGDSDGLDIKLKCYRPSYMGDGDMGLVQFVKNGQIETNIRRINVNVGLSGSGGAISSLVYGVRVNPSLNPTIFAGTVVISGNLSSMAHDVEKNQNRVYNTASLSKQELIGVTPYNGSPITGTNIWGRGDVVMDISASAGGYAGRVYTSAGFKRFGSIEA